MDWTKFGMNVPVLIGAVMSTVELIKGAKTGAEKEAAVLASVKNDLAAVEAATGTDLVNDAAIDDLMKQYIAIRVALINAVSAAHQVKPTAA